MLEIIRIAMLSSVQDAGRAALRPLGVPRSGPLDEWSHALANVLVGNGPDTAALEVGYGRSEFKFLRTAVVALTGARAAVHADGQALPRWRPIAVAAGTRLIIEPARQGMRVYLALAGGLDSTLVLDSRSALPGAPGFPGLLARAERIPYIEALPERFPGLRFPRRGDAPSVASWWADGEPLLDLDAHAALRVIDGTHQSLLEDKRGLYTGSFCVSPQANRMAVPLIGSTLQVHGGGSLISEPVLPGTIQLPPDGRPIVLLADAQTVGGYPRIGHVALVDLARLAQRPPGAQLRFEPVSIDTAQRLWLWRRERLARLGIAARDRLRNARARSVR